MKVWHIVPKNDILIPVDGGRSVTVASIAADLAGHAWHPELARKRIREVLEKTQGCLVEIVLKDISTFEYEPQRLWEWSRICSEEAENFAP